MEFVCLLTTYVFSYVTGPWWHSNWAVSGGLMQQISQVMPDSTEDQW
jgi:hypothetical protein